MYTGYAGKLRTNSNIAWQRPQSTSSRVDGELMQDSARALHGGVNDPLHTGVNDPLHTLRLLCLSRGASGIMGLGRIFRRMGDAGCKRLNKEQFLTGIKDTGVEFSDEDAEKLFAHFDPDNSGSICVDEFIRHIRPPMSDSRRTIVERAFKKLDKTEDGFIAISHLRGVYSVTANPRYQSGEESLDTITNKFLANFEEEGNEDGRVTFEEFMNYYSGISVSIESDGYFDLLLRQAYKL